MRWLSRTLQGHRCGSSADLVLQGLDEESTNAMAIIRASEPDKVCLPDACMHFLHYSAMWAASALFWACFQRIS